MFALLRLAGRLLDRSVRRAGRRVATASLLFAMALVFPMIGFVGFGVAVFILLTRLMDPALAALLLGSVAFVIAAILMLLARAQTQPARFRANPPIEEQLKLELAALLENSSTATTLAPLAVAVLIGFLMTARR